MLTFLLPLRTHCTGPRCERPVGYSAQFSHDIRDGGAQLIRCEPTYRRSVRELGAVCDVTQGCVAFTIKGLRGGPEPPQLCLYASRPDPNCLVPGPRDWAWDPRNCLGTYWREEAMPLSGQGRRVALAAAASE